jgi:hypothetical protein
MFHLICLDSLKNIDEEWVPEKRIDFNAIFEISAKTNQNVQELCLELRQLIDKLDEQRGKLGPQERDTEKPKKYIELV